MTFIFSTFKDSPYGVIGTKMSNAYVFFNDFNDSSGFNGWIMLMVG